MAKIKMDGNDATPHTGQAKSTSTKRTTSLSHNQAQSPSSTEQPPAKRPKLTLKVRAKESNDGANDTIAVSRPKRDHKPNPRHSQEMETTKSRSIKTKRQPRNSSPAPSSGMSTLSSAPPSPREQRARQNAATVATASAPPSARENYGDLMSYYIDGGDDEDQHHSIEKPGKPKPVKKIQLKVKPEAGKVKTRTSRGAQQSSSQSQPGPEPGPEPAPAPAPAPRAEPPVAANQPEPPVMSHAVNSERPPTVETQNHRQPPNIPPHVPKPPPQQAPVYYRPEMQGPPGNFPQGPPPGPVGHHAPGPPLPRHRHMQLPQPIIQFIEIQPDPKPLAADTIPVLIQKLEALSRALANFAGVPNIAATPTPEEPKPAPKKPAPLSADPLDGFLSLFGGDDDDEEDEDDRFSSAQKDILETIIAPTPGEPDTPLIFGIQFIQNALRSWAQQRMTQQVTQQWNVQQAEQFQRQMQANRRGPGRPRQYDPDQPVQPIIQMALADTPEGIAMKAFQTVLDSACLQVNCIIPIHLSQALRHLYMQIDQLINQESRSDNLWQCMSYGAQIQAHRNRVERWKEAQEHRRQLAQQQMGPEMGWRHRDAPLTAEQMQAIDVERRRSMQHAAQQPYNADQHLNPLYVGSLGSGPRENGATLPRPNVSTPGPYAGPPPPLDAQAKGAGTRQAATPVQEASGAHQATGALNHPFVPREGTAHTLRSRTASSDGRGASASRRALSGNQPGDANSPIEIDGNGDISMSNSRPNRALHSSAMSELSNSRIRRRSSASASASSSVRTSPDTIRVATRRAKTFAPGSATSTTGVANQKAPPRSSLSRKEVDVIEL